MDFFRRTGRGAGESLKEALERELHEELGCMPGIIGEELFQWEWRGEMPAINHCLSVYCNVNYEGFVLNEGMAMNWFFVRELNHSLPLVPGVMGNISKIENFLNTVFPSV